MLQALPLDGKIVCREVADDDDTGAGGREPAKAERNDTRARRTGSSR